jgi:nicotinate-nucleotide pyrophosphorylase (carboxylating)|tara:strand:- start:2950 stop:3801 length:852 start_codon:yes stop_codon:yes gene_type:complete
MQLSEELANDITLMVEVALREDIGAEDITARLIPSELNGLGSVTSRQTAVICGRPWVDEVYRQIDSHLTVDWLVQDGTEAAPGQVLFSVTGQASAILSGERTALNFLQTLSATATVSRHYSDLVKHTGAKLLDTRKTLPGLRRAQKYAVTCGGCYNHRMGLYDAFLIKENHISACGSIQAAVTAARRSHPQAKLEVEVENLQELNQAVDARPDVIMLDNFCLQDVRYAVAAVNHPIKLEASGGIESDEELIALAETGIDYISIGAMTKNCQAVDLSMRLSLLP